MQNNINIQSDIFSPNCFRPGEENVFINKNKRKRPVENNNVNTNIKQSNSKVYKNINIKSIQKKNNKCNIPCRYFHINHNCIKGDTCQYVYIYKYI